MLKNLWIKFVYFKHSRIILRSYCYEMIAIQPFIELPGKHLKSCHGLPVSLPRHPDHEWLIGTQIYVKLCRPQSCSLEGTSQYVEVILLTENQEKAVMEKNTRFHHHSTRLQDGNLNNWMTDASRAAEILPDDREVQPRINLGLLSQWETLVKFARTIHHYILIHLAFLSFNARVIIRSCEIIGRGRVWRDLYDIISSIMQVEATSLSYILR